MRRLGFLALIVLFIIPICSYADDWIFVASTEEKELFINGDVVVPNQIWIKEVYKLDTELSHDLTLFVFNSSYTKFDIIAAYTYTKTGNLARDEENTLMPNFRTIPPGTLVSHIASLAFKLENYGKPILKLYLDLMNNSRTENNIQKQWLLVYNQQDLSLFINLNYDSHRGFEKKILIYDPQMREKFKKELNLNTLPSSVNYLTRYNTDCTRYCVTAIEFYDMNGILVSTTEVSEVSWQDVNGDTSELIASEVYKEAIINDNKGGVIKYYRNKYKGF